MVAGLAFAFERVVGLAQRAGGPGAVALHAVDVARIVGGAGGVAVDGNREEADEDREHKAPCGQALGRGEASEREDAGLLLFLRGFGDGIDAADGEDCRAVFAADGDAMAAEAQFRALGRVDVGRAGGAAFDVEAEGAGGADTEGAGVELLDPRVIGFQREVGEVDVVGRCAAQRQLRLGKRRAADDLAAVCGQADLADCEAHCAHQ